jgi:hypothetical protein
MHAEIFKPNLGQGNIRVSNPVKQYIHLASFYRSSYHYLSTRTNDEIALWARIQQPATWSGYTNTCKFFIYLALPFAILRPLIVSKILPSFSNCSLDPGTDNYEHFFRGKAA